MSKIPGGRLPVTHTTASEHRPLPPHVRVPSAVSLCATQAPHEWSHRAPGGALAVDQQHFAGAIRAVRLAIDTVVHSGERDLPPSLLLARALQLLHALPLTPPILALLNQAADMLFEQMVPDTACPYPS